MINDLIELSRIEAGVKPSNHPFSLETIIFSVKSKISREAEAKGLVLTCSFG